MKYAAFCLSCLLFLMPVAAQNELETYDMESLIALIDEAGAPRSISDYVIFTAPVEARHVGIVFDFENFRTIHSFQRLDSHSPENEVTESVYFYILSVPKNVHKVAYRLITDGLWTTDPLNPKTEYNTKINSQLSIVDITRPVERKTAQNGSGSVSFTYEGAPGQRIRLAGNFTNWDSYIYTMTETQPGLYELTIPLLQGTYYYTFYNGITPLLDKTNPEKVYTQDGRMASVIHVQ